MGKIDSDNKVDRMNNNAPLISVIIPTFNRAAMLSATLESLAGQTLPTDQYEIVVVDDGSRDATPETCRGFASRMTVNYLHIENSGISAAKNAGILAARGRILLFADDDDIADSRLLEEHLKAHEQHPEENMAVLGYTTWAPILPVTPLMRYVTDIGRFLFAYGDLEDGQILDFTYFWGGRSSCKRSFLSKHGVFNSQFRFGAEDVELGYRLSHAGFRVVFHRAAVSYMARPLTFEDFCDRCERQGASLYLLSRLHSDPLIQQYCQCADPFVENRAMGVDAETRWPDVAASFDEKFKQLQRVEALLGFGFEPEALDGSPRAEAYQRQMSELFAALHKALSQATELQKQLSEQDKWHRERYGAEQQRLNTEVAQLHDRFIQTNSLLQSRSISLEEQERRSAELTERLRKELSNVRRLSRLLDDAEKAAVRLRSSRRWQLANPVNAIQAKFFPDKVSVGYGHLEKIVAAYSQWLKSHPEIAKIDEEINALKFPSGTNLHVPESERSAPILGPPEPSLPIEQIRFPTHDDVEVSIIIPVFNQLQFTKACLASLQTVEEPVRFEVIVVDDCSTDETNAVLSKVEGLVYLRNENNSGFILSCNRGAEKARGKYLTFLNNDTIVTQGWLTALIETFVEQPQAGIVGSKLVYANGRLQEAGCVIWRDASGWNYGKFDDPHKPPYNYLREVDYCSAAALMIPKALFDSLGGFDTKYAPAYYEDTDLAFRVRERGYRVLYQPLSEVIHYEGATGGTDLSTGTKKHQEINRAIFAQRWAAELETRPVAGHTAALEQSSSGRKSILVIDHHLPMPERDSGSLRMFHILKLLQQLGHRVTFIPDNLADIPPYTAQLQKCGIEVWHHPYITTVRDYLETHAAKVDAVVLSRCDFACKHIDDVRLHAPQSRVIFDTVDLHFVREDRHARLTSDAEALRNAEEKQRVEHRLIDQADETWVVSPIEQQLLQKNRPEKSIQVVSNIVDIPGSNTPFALRRDWLFIGSFQHPPNVDGVSFFLRDVYPLVLERLTDVKFYIIGEKAPVELLQLASENVIFTGIQPDLRPFFDTVKLSIAPLRYGAGVKGKINQSMAWGVPVVATSIAIEGMGLTPNEDILVADTPAEFARALVELYESEGLWSRLSENGLNKTRELYSIETAQRRLAYLFSDEHINSSHPEMLSAKHSPAALTGVYDRKSTIEVGVTNNVGEL